MTLVAIAVGFVCVVAALCRRCHMESDGRLQAVRENPYGRKS